jgi:hypothetical protein
MTRDELNRRLEAGEPDAQVLAWLQALPEMQAGLAPDWSERPLSEEDLSAWKAAGYRDWLAQQQALEQARQLAAEVADLKQAGNEHLTEMLAQFLAAQYVLATKAAVRQANGGPVDLKTLQALCADLAALRRGDHSAERLSIERQRVSLEYDWLIQAKEDSLLRHKKKLLFGLQALQKYVTHDHPEAKAAFDVFLKQVGSPLDQVDITL